MKSNVLGVKKCENLSVVTSCNNNIHCHIERSEISLYCVFEILRFLAKPQYDKNIIMTGRIKIFTKNQIF